MGLVCIKFLGTGDGAASADRFCTAILLRSSGYTCLFDCGEPVSHSLAKMGMGFDEIDRVFLSHLHADHFGGLPMLLQAMWMAGRKKKLPVHLPAEGVELVETLRRMMYLFPEAMPYSVELLPHKSGVAVEHGGSRVIPYLVTHLAGARAKYGAKYQRPFESFCFRIEIAGGKTVVFSGDIGQPADLAAALATGADLLIVELAHFTPQVLFDYLGNQNVGRIIVTHVAPPEQMSAMEHLALKMLGRRVVFAEDGMEVSL